VEISQKNVVVNYTYYLGDNKSLSELQKLLFKYSFLKNKEHNFIINIHCNDNFKKVCEELEIVPDNFYPLEEDVNINGKVFWAYHKIKVYDKCSIGEIHLDIDAVLKDFPILRPKYSLQVAHADNPDYQIKNLSISENYNLPEFAKPDLIGYNMSAVCFHSQELKDLYCKNALAFMQNNDVLFDNGWAHMVFIEQASLKQICEYYNYSYKFFVDDIDYYHLGAMKNMLTDEEKNDLINKIKNRIWQLQALTILKS